MSFLHLKNKTEPKYADPRTATIQKDVFDIKTKPEKKIIENISSLVAKQIINEISLVLRNDI